MKKFASFATLVFWLTAIEVSAEPTIDVASLPGKFFFIGNDLNELSASDRGSASQIYVMNANGTDRRKMAPAYDSPGNLIWYAQQRRLGFNNISTDPNLNGWSIVDVTAQAENMIAADRSAKSLPDDFPVKFFAPRWQVVNGKSEIVPNARNYNSPVTFSPDHGKVAGVVYKSDVNAPGAFRVQMCIVGVSGGDAARCVESVEPCVGHLAAWSPDGKWLVFVGRLKEDRAACNLFELFMVDREGRSLRQLTNVPGPKLGKSTAEAIVTPGMSLDHWHKSGQPVWSPDSQWIAFESAKGIAKVRPDGTGFQKIAAGFSPTWSPEGSMIAYVVPRADSAVRRFRAPPPFGPSSIFVIRTDGTGATEIAATRFPPFSYRDLNWAK